MSPFLISVTFFCLMGAAATALYAVFYGSHKVMQERFEEMTAQVRTNALVNAGDEPLSPGTGTGAAAMGAAADSRAKEN